MESAILITLQLIQSLISQLGVNSNIVNQILAALIQVVPLVINLAPSLVNSVKAIITALENSGALTDDQLATLANLSAELDAAWQTTVAAYNASKGVAAPTPAPTSAVMAAVTTTGATDPLASPAGAVTQ